MAFSKSFPRTPKGSNYPVWEEIFLNNDEEKLIEDSAIKENIVLMKTCIEHAKSILTEKNFKDYQTDIVNMAIALFEKTSSHQVYHKENKCKEKFDKLFNSEE